VGRTGRKREGFVHVLLAEGREETNWNKAREAYNQVQRSIIRGDQLELYDDVERLLPDHVKPECLEMMMEIQEYDRSATERSRQTAAKGPSKKRKRNDDPTRDIPPGASTGFVSVADLLVKQKKDKKRKKVARFDENAGLDDDTDEEIEAGLFAPRRATSMSAVPSTPPKINLKRAKTMANKKKKGKAAAPRPKRVRADDTEMTSSQFARVGAEDSDDKEIERGLRSAPVRRPSRPPSLVPSGSSRPTSPDLPLAQNQSVIDICTSASSRSPSPSYEVQHSTPVTPRSSGNILTSQHVPPSPAKSSTIHEPDAAAAPESHCGSDGGCSDRNIHLNECEPSKEEDSLAWLLEDSEDGEGMESGPSQPRPSTSKLPDSDVIAVEDSELEDESPIIFISSPTRPAPHETSPPAISSPPRLWPSVPHDSPVIVPSPSLPVRAAGRAKKRLAVADSSSPAHPPLSQKRLRRRSSESHSPSPPPPLPAASSPHPPAKKRRRQKLKVRDTAAAARLNPWIDVEAAHSGDEVSDGSASASSEAGEEDGSDRRFVTDLPPTQASPSYDQSAVYRQSLLSQAPAGRSFAVPVFAAPPVRRGGGVRGLLRADVARRRQDIEVARTSSPPPDEEDYYMLGSFVVDDETEILSVMQSSEP
jgi:ATP-dependent DNA helicase MPH1